MTKPPKRTKAVRPRARPRPTRKRLTTVRIPAPFEPIFLKAQEYVSRYFSRKDESPELGTISISGERYILLRAASMSVEFFDLVMSLYQDKGVGEARSVASNLLFDVHAIGKADARSFHGKMGVTDPIDKLSAGPIHFSSRDGPSWRSSRSPIPPQTTTTSSSTTTLSPSSPTRGSSATARAASRSA